MVVASIAVFIALAGTSTAAGLNHALWANRAGTSNKVDGLSASRTAKPGRLLALNKDGKFPSSVIPGSAKGDPGAQGSQGDKGAKGAKGDQGATGAQGPTGAQGSTGPTGAPGISTLISTSGSTSFTTGTGFLEENQQFFSANGGGEVSANLNDVVQAAPGDVTVTRLKTRARFNSGVTFTGPSAIVVRLYVLSNPFDPIDYGSDGYEDACVKEYSGQPPAVAGDTFECDVTAAQDVTSANGLAMAVMFYSGGNATPVQLTVTTALTLE